MFNPRISFSFMNTLLERSFSAEALLFMPPINRNRSLTLNHLKTINSQTKFVYEQAICDAIESEADIGKSEMLLN